MKATRTFLTFVIPALLTLSQLARAQSTAFTYQGRLSQAGTAANGLYEMSFGLYDAATNGTLVGTPVTVAPVAVSNGLFTVTLDFGAGAFTGAPRWLDITLNLYGSDMVPTTLHPRQPLTPTPYAIHAANAANLMSFVNAPLDIKVNGLRALRLEYVSNIFGTGVNVVGGFSGNVVSNGVTGGTIAGGGAAAAENSVGDDFATIGGGSANTASGLGATIGGGDDNLASGHYASVGGGEGNTASGDRATIGGGDDNLTSGYYASVGGGKRNNASGDRATIGGGERNSASGWWATIAGGQGNVVGSAAHAAIGGGLTNRIGADADYAFIGGGIGNQVQDDAAFAAIGGGSDNAIVTSAAAAVIGGGHSNLVQFEADYATIGGGRQNTVSTNAIAATIGGGDRNLIGLGAFNATVGGGSGHVIAAPHATVAGGEDHRIASGATWATIGGGSDNCVEDGAYGASVGGGSSCVVQSNAFFATIPGGAGNVAGGPHSFAAGRAARALHQGAFVWADSLSGPLNIGMAFASMATNEFAARTTGGARFVSAVDPTNGTPAAGVSLAPGGGAWSSLSDRNAKEHFAAANGREILEKVAVLPLATWNYKSQDKSIRHIGPTAQDFKAAFGLGENDRTISTVDADGVALAAIQGLNQKMEEQLKAKDGRIKELEQRLERLERLINWTHGGAK